MVTKNELTDFGQVLFEALRKKGLTPPVIPNMKEVYEKYKNFSPKQMADEFAKDHDLRRVTEMYNILNRINNQEKIQEMQEARKFPDIPNRCFSLALESYPDINVVRTGKFKQHYWVGKKPPSTESAKNTLSWMDEMYAAELPETIKKDIVLAVENNLTYTEFVADKNYPNKYRYRLEAYYHPYRHEHKKKQNKPKTEKIITEARYKVTGEELEIVQTTNEIRRMVGTINPRPFEPMPVDNNNHEYERVETVGELELTKKATGGPETGIEQPEPLKEVTTPYEREKVAQKGLFEAKIKLLQHRIEVYREEVFHLKAVKESQKELIEKLLIHLQDGDE